MDFFGSSGLVDSVNASSSPKRSMKMADTSFGIIEFFYEDEEPLGCD